MLPVEEILDTPAIDQPSPIGRSRDGRPIHGYRFGSGPVAVSCLGGCHADEPVGPWMLERLAGWLATREPEDEIVTGYRWAIVPHANPDGEPPNREWSNDRVRVSSPRGPDIGFRLDAYVGGVVRESPGDDVEFGFPTGPEDEGARPENRSIARFLAEGGPWALHVSFHGMGFGHGPWFLLEPSWVERTRRLRERLARKVRELGYRLHEVDRGGEKGFWRIDRGFTTRPDSRAMRDYFLARDDRETADRFRPSSMEFVRSLGAPDGDPLTMVSEMPLFLLPEEGPLADPALPRLDRLEVLHRAIGEHGVHAADRLGIRPMPIRDQMRLQLELLGEGVRTVERYGGY